MTSSSKNQNKDHDSMTQVEQHAVFTQLLSREWNKYCADCSVRSPTWASIDFGAFICIDCAGAHRALGPTVTRVRSTNLDLWKKSWIYHMVIGNDKVNEYWEAQLQQKEALFGKQKRQSMKLKFNATRAERQRAAVVKYVRRKYVSENQQNIMVALKTKIENQKRIKLHLIQKVKQLESIRDQPYVENQYQRIAEPQVPKILQTPQKPQKPCKPFDFFDEPETEILVKPQSLVKPKSKQFQVLQVIFPCEYPKVYHPHSPPITMPKVQQNTNSFFTAPVNNNIVIPNPISVHLQFFSKSNSINPVISLKNPQPLPVVNTPFFFQNEIAQIKPFSNVNHLPKLDFGFKPCGILLNSDPFNINMNLRMQSPISASKIQSKYQSFNEFS